MWYAQTLVFLPSGCSYLLVGPVCLHQGSIQTRFHIVKLLVILQRVETIKKKN